MDLVNDTLFSKEAVGHYEHKPLKPHKPKETSGNENRETSK